jgi:hypothetical protein
MRIGMIGLGISNIYIYRYQSIGKTRRREHAQQGRSYIFGASGSMETSLPPPSQYKWCVGLVAGMTIVKVFWFWSVSYDSW